MDWLSIAFEMSSICSSPAMLIGISINLPCIFAQLSLKKSTDLNHKMDKFSFLNAANTAYFAELYDKYLQHPDSVEPSWRAFFQGFDFGVEESGIVADFSDSQPDAAPAQEAVPDRLQKEFQVVKLIDGSISTGGKHIKPITLSFNSLTHSL